MNFCFPFFDMSLNEKKGKPHRLYFHLGVICSIYETVSNVIWETRTVLCLVSDGQQCLEIPIILWIQRKIIEILFGCILFHKLIYWLLV